jgi:hypothetical protein
MMSVPTSQKTLVAFIIKKNIKSMQEKIAVCSTSHAGNIIYSAILMLKMMDSTATSMF